MAADALRGDWMRYLLGDARRVARRSKDPSTKVGAVLVSPDTLPISRGFNGFPKGVLDTMTRYEDREEKYRLIVHAEINALLFAGGIERTRGAVLFIWPLPPCPTCAGAIINAGVSAVVFPAGWGDGERGERWREPCDFAIRTLVSGGVSVFQCDLGDDD